MSLNPRVSRSSFIGCFVAIFCGLTHVAGCSVKLTNRKPMAPSVYNEGTALQYALSFKFMFTGSLTFTNL